MSVISQSHGSKKLELKECTKMSPRACLKPGLYSNNYNKIYRLKSALSFWEFRLVEPRAFGLFSHFEASLGLVKSTLSSSSEPNTISHESEPELFIYNNI